MSTTNRAAGICGSCKRIVQPGCGTIRHWNGAARSKAPLYAKRSAYGILSTVHCVDCDQLHMDGLRDERLAARDKREATGIRKIIRGF
jgi:hypothetical protein